MRNVGLIAFGIGLLVLQSTVATLLPIYAFAPNLLLPIVIYLGVKHDVHVVRGAAISFVLGYLLDAFCGSPMGLQTFTLVATFLLARFAGLRFFMRGPVFQIVLTFVVSILTGGMILALRAIFEQAKPFPTSTLGETGLTLLFPAIATALLSPIIFRAVRWLEGWSSTKRDDRNQDDKVVAPQ
ncbi:MAG: rod shape-determining protein MreD [Myxococcota bacterium]